MSESIIMTRERSFNIFYIKNNMRKMSSLDWVSFVLLVVGGLNWGLVSLNFNLVDYIFGTGSLLSTIVYALVGLSAIYSIFSVKKMSG